MATTLQPPPVARLPISGGIRSTADPEAPKTGVWIGLAAITMTFAAFTSAMIVRQGSGNDWRHFSFPPILYLNTLVLLASSFTLQISRRRFAAVSNQVQSAKSPLPTLYLTLGLGCFFVAGQYTAWLQLRSQGLYLASAPSSSFFYVFTVLHAFHILGGLAGLLLVITRLRRMTLRRSTLDAASQYWHFMDALWLYLLFLLWTRI
jgi:cytochrome c oxidase subunit 3